MTCHPPPVSNQSEQLTIRPRLHDTQNCVKTQFCVSWIPNKYGLRPRDQIRSPLMKGSPLLETG